MIQNLKDPEVVILLAKQLVDQGVMLASSPLIRGDETTLIAQVVVRNLKGELYSLGYRQPYPGEVQSSE